MDEEKQPLVLIPDPQSQRVWENLRRIVEWANQESQDSSESDRFLLMGS
jgi:hypothetical protein